MSDLHARLEAAERVCILLGWTLPAAAGNERTKALKMLWRTWTEVSGTDPGPMDRPDLSEDVIADLARQHDEILALEHGLYLPADD